MNQISMQTLEPKNKDITFSFGENWMDYIQTVDEQAIVSARKDIEDWLGPDFVRGKRVIDIGCGSGIHSLCYHHLGAKELVSLDYDIQSVNATKTLWEKAGRPEHWKVQHGSVLDDAFVKSLGQFDIVYSWGVLHHTGKMWDAIRNSWHCIAPGGAYWISIYVKTDKYDYELGLKQQYNRSSDFGKKMMVYRTIFWHMRYRLLHFKNPFAWNEKKGRGMDTYHDIVDWLGGLPYEVATKDEIEKFCAQGNLKLQRFDDTEACIVYLFKAA